LTNGFIGAIIIIKMVGTTIIKIEGAALKVMSFNNWLPVITTLIGF